MATCSIAPRSSPSATKCSRTASLRTFSRSRRREADKALGDPRRELRAGAVADLVVRRSGERRGRGRRPAAANARPARGAHRRRARRPVRSAGLGSRRWRGAGRRNGDRSANGGGRTGAPGAARGARRESDASSRYGAALRHNGSGVPLGARFATSGDRFLVVPGGWCRSCGRSRRRATARASGGSSWCVPKNVGSGRYYNPEHRSGSTWTEFDPLFSASRRSSEAALSTRARRLAKRLAANSF